jgi:hypothetical protein
VTEDAGAGADGTGDAVLAERDGDGVLTLTFNRPERRDGWAEDLQEAHQERAFDLLLPARTFDAAEAGELGLVGRVPRDEVLAAAQAYARDLALHCSPRAMAVIASQVLDGSADLREGMASFVERRAPLGPPPD